MNLPKVGRYYWHYDDGKISFSRQEKVLITKISLYDAISEEDKEKIKNEIKRYNWIYNKSIPYVVYGINKTLEDWDPPVDINLIYLLSENGWYGFSGSDINQGRLDIDGSITKFLNSQFKTNYQSLLFPEK